MSKWTKIAIAVGASLVLGGSALGVYFGIDRTTTSTTAALATSGKTATTTTSTTSTVLLSRALQPVTDHILAIWSPDLNVTIKALVTNGNGDVVDIEWGNEGDVSGWSYCAIEHKNQFFILGQVSDLIFSLFDILKTIKL